MDGDSEGRAPERARERGGAAIGTLCAIVGFTCFVAWMNMLLCFEGLLRDGIAYGGGVVHDPFFVGSLACATAMLLLADWRARSGAASASAGRGGIPPVPRGRAALLASVLGSVASAAAVALAFAATADGPAVRAAAGLLGAAAGFSFASFTLGWGRQVASLALKPALAVMGAALCLQWPLLSLAILGGLPAKAVCAAVLPLVSGWCLRRLLAPPPADDDAGPGDARRRPAGASAPPRASSPSENRAQGRRPRLDPAVCRIAGALFCFSFVIQFVWTCHIGFGETPLDEGFFWALFLCVFAVVPAVVGVSLVLMRRAKAYRAEFFYRASFVFAIVACTSLSVAPMTPLLPYASVYVAYALVVLTMWLLAWSAVFLRNVAPERAFGTVFGLQFAAFIAGFAASKALEHLVGTTGGIPLLPWICVGSCAVLSCAFCFVLPEKDLLELSPRLLGLNRAGLEDRVADLSERYGLTGREAEIFSYLARGRDVGYIEQELFISRNTVNAHRKNLYRKLGIHTQQELLSLIEEPEGLG